MELRAARPLTPSHELALIPTARQTAVRPFYSQGTRAEARVTRPESQDKDANRVMTLESTPLRLLIIELGTGSSGPRLLPSTSTAGCSVEM